MNLTLEWRKPTTGCWLEVKRDWVWIRVMGLPLSLWSQKILKRIRDQYGGFIKTEEETNLQSSLGSYQGEGGWGKGSEGGKDIQRRLCPQSTDLL